MAILVNGSEIVLSGAVGNFYDYDGFTADDVIAALAGIDKATEITIRINSGGGVASEGAAIHSAFAAHKGRKTVLVEGIAASAASLIAMVGDDIVMSRGAIMMVHDPSGLTYGTVADHELQIRTLETYANAAAGIYSDQTGTTPAQVRADMRAELWMTPEEAVQKGYADRVAPRQGANDNVEPAAFNYRIFQHAPDRLIALADLRSWTKGTRPVASVPIAKPLAARGQDTKPVSTRSGVGAGAEMAMANMRRMLKASGQTPVELKR